MINKYIKELTGIVLGLLMVFSSVISIKAEDVPADVLAVQQLLKEQQEFCAKQQQILQQQAANAQALTAQKIAADQQAAVAQNAQNLQAYQAALLLQYQQAYADQYAKALFIQQALAKQQVSSFEHTLLLNSIQAMQKAQYESLVKNGNYEYADYLLSEYSKYIDASKLPYKAYEGLK